MTNHSAGPSYIGYAYQPLQALLLLLRSPDDEAFVTVETEDDVVLSEEGQIKNYQLKHKQRNISIKSDDFWRTLSVWLDFISKNDTEETPYFCLTIISSIKNGDPLSALEHQPSDREPEDMEKLEEKLEQEAMNVHNARNATTIPGGKLPFEERATACETFLSTIKEKRTKLLSRCFIISACPNIVDIQIEIQKELRTVHPKIKKRLTERLVDWWSGQALKTITGERNQKIHKGELQAFLMETGAALDRGRFIDDMRSLNLPENPPMGSVNQKQHDLIGALPHIKRRSACSGWLASEQRSRWIKDDPSCVGKLNDFDDGLIREWDWRFKDKYNKCQPHEDEYQKMGHSILDWTHEDAQAQVAPIREGWNHPDLVRGSYQVLADRLDVGWHPHYKIKIEGNSDE